MTDPETAFEAEPTPPELDEGRSDDQVQTLTSNRASDFEDATDRQPCTNGDCPYADDPKHPLEEAWIELMSPVPKRGQEISLQPSQGIAQPNELIFQQVRDAIRPPDSGLDDHAIETVRTGWAELHETHLNDMPARLNLKLTQLSQSWEGTDFDAFAEQVEVTRTNLVEALDEIDTARAELETVEEDIYAQQGNGGQVPFPAPDVWRAGSSAVNDSKIHVRAPWVSGDCTKDRGEGESWENLGLPENFTQDIEELINERTAEYVEAGRDPEEARLQARSDYDQSLLEYGEHFSETMKRASDEYNEGIQQRHSDMTSAQSEPALAHNDRAPADIADADYDVPMPELTSPPSPEPPPLGDFGSDYNAPPADPPNLPDPHSGLSSPSGPSGGGLGDYGSPGGLGSPGSVTGGSGFDPDDNPWGASGDDDEIGGGLASGGVGAPGGLPGGGGGVGAPSGLGAGGGVGGAVMPGALGGAGGARGAGAGGRGAGGARGATARGAAGAGRGAGRGGPGMMGGGRGGAGTGENEEGRETWLTEDEDVWGVGNEEDDPYA